MIAGITLRHVKQELRRLSKFYGVPASQLESVIEELGLHLNDYSEIVLTEFGFEIITGGCGKVTANRFASIAKSHGAPAMTTFAFSQCAAEFPHAMLGLKLCFGQDACAPTLYVRVMQDTQLGLDSLSRLPNIGDQVARLRRRMSDTRTLYGLAFSADSLGELVVKSYSIADIPQDLATVCRNSGSVPGFISHRITRHGVTAEPKRYLPDIPWNRLDGLTGRWRDIAEFAHRELGYDTAGHVGVIESEDGTSQVKLYVERIGAIPTNFSAR